MKAEYPAHAVEAKALRQAFTSLARMDASTGTGSVNRVVAVAPAAAGDLLGGKLRTPRTESSSEQREIKGPKAAAMTFDSWLGADVAVFDEADDERDALSNVQQQALFLYRDELDDGGAMIGSPRDSPLVPAASVSLS